MSFIQSVLYQVPLLFPPSSSSCWLGGFPTEYRLEVKQHLQDWSSDGVLRINTSELTHNLTGLDTLTRYDARVLSVNFNGPSDFSPTAEFATVGELHV